LLPAQENFGFLNKGNYILDDAVCVTLLSCWNPSFSGDGDDFFDFESSGSEGDLEFFEEMYDESSEEDLDFFALDIASTVEAETGEGPWSGALPAMGRLKRMLVGVFNLALTSKFVVCVPGFRWFARRGQDLYWFRQNVPTSNHRRFALPAPLMIESHSRGYKQAREGGEAPKSLIRGQGGYRVESYLSLGLAAGLQPLGPPLVQWSF
jgi:hypothetical protein